MNVLPALTDSLLEHLPDIAWVTQIDPSIVRTWDLFFKEHGGSHIAIHQQNHYLTVSLVSHRTGHMLRSYRVDLFNPNYLEEIVAVIRVYLKEGGQLMLIDIANQLAVRRTQMSDVPNPLNLPSP